MDENNAGAVVIVGAGTRIGRTIATELSKRGFKVGIVDYGVDDARSTLEMVRKTCSSAEICYCDIHNMMELQAMAEHFCTAWGKVDLLVNNPGMDGCGRCAGDIPVQEWEEILCTNLLGVAYVCQAFMPCLTEQSGGHIANGTYGAGIIPGADHIMYQIARAGVISYTNKLKAELAPHNIGVTMLHPTLIDTRNIDDWLRVIGLLQVTGDWL
jgi:NAD(P)-dependent dehydrogenase (short-subunit alcohol dehydrogenase family)